MNEQLYMSFELYLNNEMTPEDRIAFERRLQDDADFNAAFEAYQETTLLLEHKFSEEREAFRQNLAAISDNYFAEEGMQKTKVVSLKPWYYVAVASLVIGFGTWFALQDSNPEYYDFNQHEAAHFTERNETDAHLKAAQDFFNHKDYQRAAEAFEKITDASPEVRYFYAISLIETNKYAKAKDVLEELEEGSSLYKEKAIWYSALSELKQGNREACKAKLRELSEDAEDYQKARKLLKDLE